MCAIRILVVGGGLTAAALSCRLAGLPVSLTCWDKAFRPGGRMTTKKLGNAQIDLGPQYITRQFGEDDLMFKELLEKGILKPIKIENHYSKENQAAQNSSNNENEDEKVDDVDVVTVGVDDTIHKNKSGDIYLMKPENYVAVNGTEQLVQHFWSKSGISPLTQHFLSELNHYSQTNHWTAKCSTQNKTETFDAVILTQPVPQYINTISPEGRPNGNYLDKVKENREIYENLRKIKYFSSFSLGLFYNKSDKLNFGWRMRYFPENKILRYVSVDSLRPATSVCVQTQRSWSETNSDLEKHEASPVILKELRTQVPNLPEPDDMIAHRWLYSQTKVHYPQAPGAVQLFSSPLLIGAGDSFSVSNVEGCLHSARIAAQIITENYNL